MVWGCFVFDKTEDFRDNIHMLDAFKKLLNTRFVLHSFQTFVGANQWKSKLYPSVFTKPGNVLDFGCSYGNTTECFKAREYWGVDIDGPMLEVAKKHFASYPNIHFELVDILKDEFKPGYFDHALFASASHHISNDDLGPIFEALLNNLKPGGELHFFDIFKKPDDKLTTRILTALDQGKFIRTLPEYEAFFNTHSFPIAEQRVIKSPDAKIQLWDFLYVKMVR